MATRKNIATSTAVELTVNPETFQGWSKLEPNEQASVKTESTALREAQHLESQSKLAIGEHLTKLREILEPKRMFLSFLTEVFDMSRATAYRYMNLYSLAQQALTPPVLEMAIQRSTRITPEMLKANPAPVTTDRSKIAEYLSSLKPIRVEVAKSPETLLKECVNFVSSRWDQLPQHQRTRQTFINSLVGMLLNRFGVASEKSFAPIAIPESFKGARGRPRKAA